MAADQEKIAIVIDAVNNASSALASIKNDLKALDDGSKKAGSGFDDLQKKMKAVGSSLAQVGAVMTASFTVPIVAGLKSAVDAAVSFEDQLANVRKTTGATVQELDKIGESLLEMSSNTRTSADELVQIATIGGQMGIAANDVVGFTEAIDKANVALGDEFSGGAEEITQQMGILRNLFSDIKSDDVSDDLLKTSNAINVLGAAGLATGGYVTEAAKRIAGIGVPLGQTSGEVLGLSATMQELGINVERGSTAVGTTLQLMAKNTEGFAKVAGKSTKEFTDLVNSDVNGAFIAVLDGINELNPSTTELATILDDLGVDGRGAGELFLKMAANTDLLREKQDLASEALKNTDSIMGEYNIKNETTAAQLDKLKNNFIILGTTIGKVLLPAINSIVERIVPLVQGFAKFAEANPQLVKMGTVVALLVAALGPLLLVIGGITVAIGALLTPIGLVVGGIVAGIAAFTALGVALSQNEAASQALSDIWNNSLKPVFQGLYDFIAPIAQLVGGILVGAFNGLVGVLSAIAGPLGAVASLFGELLSVAGNIISVVGGTLKGAFESAKEGVGGFFTGLREGIPFLDGFLDSVGGLLSGGLDLLKAGFNAAKEGLSDFNDYLQRGPKDITTYEGALLELSSTLEKNSGKGFESLKEEILETSEVTTATIDEMQAKINEFLGIEPPNNLEDQFIKLQESTELARQGAAKNLQLIADLAGQTSESFRKSVESQGFVWETFGQDVANGTIDAQKAIEVFEKAVADSGSELDGVTDRLNVGLDNVRQNLDKMAVAGKGMEVIGQSVDEQVRPALDQISEELIKSSNIFRDVFNQQKAGWIDGKASADEYFKAIQVAIATTEEVGGTLGGNFEEVKTNLKEVETILANTGSASLGNILPQNQVDTIISNLQSIITAGSESSEGFRNALSEMGITAENLEGSIASNALSIEDAVVSINRAATDSKDEIGESFGLIEEAITSTSEIAQKYGVDMNKVADTTGVAARESSLTTVKSLLDQQKAIKETGTAQEKFAVDVQLANARASVSAKDYSDAYKETYGTLESSSAKSASELAKANGVIINGTQKLIGDLKTKLNQAGVDSGQGLANGLKSQLSTVQGAVGLMKNLFNTAGSDAGQGLINGLKSKIGGVIQAAIQIAQAAATAAKNNLQIQSPSKVFEEIGADTTAGFALGIQRGTPAVLDEINRLTNGTIEEQKELVGLLESALSFEGGAGITRGGEIVDTFSSFEEAIGKVKDAIKDLNADTNEFMSLYNEVALEASKAWSGFEPPEGIVDTYDELNEGLKQISDSIQEAVDSHEDFVAEAQKGLDDYGKKLEDINKKFDAINAKFDEMAEKSAIQAGGEIGDAVVDALEKEKKLNEDILAVKTAITEKEIEVAGIISEGGDSSNALKSLETEKEKLSVLESQKTTVEQLIAQYAEINNNAGQLTEKLEQNAEATTKAEEALAKLQGNSKATTDQITAQQEKINALKQEELILIGKQIISQQSLEEANAKIQDAKEKASLSEIDYIALNLAREQQAIEEKRKLEMAAKEEELLALKEIQTVQQAIIDGKIKKLDTSTLTTDEAIKLAEDAKLEEEQFKGKLATQIALLNEYKATEETIYAEQKAELEAQQAEYESFILASYDTIIAKLDQLRQAAIAAAAAQSKVKGGGFSEGGFTGFDKGGFTGAGNLKDVAGFVHKGEWVGPNWMVKRFAPLFKSLEGIRQGRMAGFEEGGMVGGPALPAQNTFHQPITINPVVQGNVDFNQWANYLSWKMRTG